MKEFLLSTLAVCALVFMAIDEASDSSVTHSGIQRVVLIR
jgi:hypothetical protein